MLLFLSRMCATYVMGTTPMLFLLYSQIKCWLLRLELAKYRIANREDGDQTSSGAVWSESALYV